MRKILRRKSRNIWSRSTQSIAGSNRRLLDRYIGLECELFCRHPKGAQRNALVEYAGLLKHLGDRIPLAPSSDGLRWFLANGSSITLEIGGSADLSKGLLEIATPEARSPREIACYQLANERLLEEAFKKVRPSSDWSLIKSNYDSQGHTLGQHESYDMTIARGGWLLMWWIGLVLMLAPLLLYRMAAFVWLTAMLVMG